MQDYWWIFWAVVGVMLIVAEIFTLSFFLFWFGIGALAAALAGSLGVGFVGQFLIFAVVSSVLTVMSRTILHDYFSSKNSKNMRTGADSLPGQIGVVTGAAKGHLNQAEVKVYGSTWAAILDDEDEPLREGEKVEVLRVEGATIYVKRPESLPEWRK